LAPLADPDELSILDVKLDWEAARQNHRYRNVLAALVKFLPLGNSDTLAGEFQGIVTGPMPSLLGKHLGILSRANRATSTALGRPTIWNVIRGAIAPHWLDTVLCLPLPTFPTAGSGYHTQATGY